MSFQQKIIIAQIELSQVPYDLLLLADPSMEKIEKYISDSSVFTGTVDGNVVACYVLQTLGNSKAEVKNIAVREDHQNMGIGRAMLRHAINTAKEIGINELLIGTGNSSLNQLHFYQKEGFRIKRIEKDFFTKNYPEPIIENGIKCIDMIILSMQF